MREAIHRFLDAEEHDEQEMAEDRTRWERYRATGEHVTHTEMGTWLDGLADAAAQRARRS